ncbi:MAG TPA: prephenate dehydrogenase [Planctomycetota bacterium]|nr:prephenate dehydrogenase [Planctomycetota bacterium]
MLFKTVAIVGVGLIGGSLGAALRDRRAAERVRGIGYRTSTLQQAMQLGCVDEVTTDAAEGVRDADLVVLATPVRLIAAKARELAGSVPPGCLITDVGSSKKLITEQLDAIFDGRARYVGSHPMAGSEKRGSVHSSRGLFEGALCILTPTPRTDGEALRHVARMWQAVGARTDEMSPEEHDRRVAFASHLIHVAAACMVNAQSPGSLDCASSGFADTTRVAGSDPQLWRDICLDNSAEIAAAIDTLIGELGDFKAIVENGDADALLRKFTQAAEARRAWNQRRPA